MIDNIARKIEAIVNSKSITILVNELTQILSLLEDENSNIACAALSQAIKEQINSFEYDNKYGELNKGLYILDETQSSLFLLNSYTAGIIEIDEMIENIKSFIENCADFVEEDTEPIEKEPILEIFDNCEENCGAISFITENEPLYILLFNNISLNKSYLIRGNNDKSITLPLFNLSTNVKPELYMGNALGNILYDKLAKVLIEEYIHKELCKCIPDVRSNMQACTRNLFSRYFLQTTFLKPRKPQNWSHYDDYLKSVIVCSFFKRIIEEVQKE